MIPPLPSPPFVLSRGEAFFSHMFILYHQPCCRPYMCQMNAVLLHKFLNGHILKGSIHCNFPTEKPKPPLSNVSLDSRPGLPQTSPWSRRGLPRPQHPLYLPLALLCLILRTSRKSLHRNLRLPLETTVRSICLPEKIFLTFVEC